jgi:hypothetical protein
MEAPTSYENARPPALTAIAIITLLVLASIAIYVLLSAR